MILLHQLGRISIMTSNSFQVHTFYFLDWRSSLEPCITSRRCTGSHEKSLCENFYSQHLHKQNSFSHNLPRKHVVILILKLYGMLTIFYHFYHCPQSVVCSERHNCQSCNVNTAEDFYYCRKHSILLQEKRLRGRLISGAKPGKKTLLDVELESKMFHYAVYRASLGIRLSKSIFLTMLHS